jgi:hypothetical protein
VTALAEILVCLVALVALVTFDFALMAIMRIWLKGFSALSNHGIRDMTAKALLLGHWYLLSFAVALIALNPSSQMPISGKCLVLRRTVGPWNAGCQSNHSHAQARDAAQTRDSECMIRSAKIQTAPPTESSVESKREQSFVPVCHSSKK